MTKYMPIRGAGLAAPLALFSKEQARKNHDQTLERLSERGGVDPIEGLALIEEVHYRAVLANYHPGWAALEIVKHALRQGRQIVLDERFE